MKVAFVSQPRDAIAAADTQTGSVAIVTWELARRLAGRHEVTVYAPRAPGQARTEVGPGGVRIHRAPHAFRSLHKVLDLAQGIAGIGQPYFASPLFFREYIRWVAAELARRPVDLVHLQSYAQFLPLLRSALPEARLVLHAHDESLAELDRATTRHRLGYASAVVICGGYLTRRLRRRFPELAARIHTIGNGVDLDRFTPPDRRRAHGPGHRLLFVGRVSPEKGVHVLMDAFTRLARCDPSVELDVVGPEGLFPFGFVRLLLGDPHVAPIVDFYGYGLAARVRKQILGARTSYRRALAARLPEDDRSRVRFHGAVGHHRLPDFYRRADLFMLPSVCNEPFGIPLVEAMAAGLPVVATRSGGVPEIVTDGVTGLLVDRGDPEALATAIRALLSDPTRRTAMAVAARQQAVAGTERSPGWSPCTGSFKIHYVSNFSSSLPDVLCRVGPAEGVDDFRVNLCKTPD